MNRKCFVVLGVFFLPMIASASVRVSEVAWMGDKESSSHEWIELFNDGSEEVTIDGWKLESAAGSFSIALKGDIGAGGYYLIERTSDASASGAKADLVASFGSGLRNSGDTLRLIDASGSSEDEVEGGDDWKAIGGDNESKNTAQLSGGIWVTAPGTPRAANASASAGSSTNDPTSSATSPDDDTPPSASSIADKNSTPKNIPTKIEMSSPSDAFVRDDVKFSVNILGTDQRYGENDVVWNFGDGTTAKGKNVAHRFLFSGNSTVVVSVMIAGVEFAAQKKITVRDVSATINTVVDGLEGYIKIASKSRVDIGGWVLRDGKGEFVFAPHTIVDGGSISLANAVTGMFVHVTPALFDRTNRLIFAYGDKEIALAGDDRHSDDSAPRSISSSRVSTKSVEPTITKSEVRSTSSRAVSMLGDSERTALIGHVGNSRAAPYYAALLGLVGVSCLVAYFASRRLDPRQASDDETGKYRIIEMDSNLDGSA